MQNLCNTDISYRLLYLFFYLRPIWDIRGRIVRPSISFNLAKVFYMSEERNGSHP